MDIEKTLAERGNRYGDFSQHAIIAQALKDAMWMNDGWHRLTPAMRQALEVIQDKVARILNGDPTYADNWHDIIGYARLVEKMLTPEPERKKLLSDERRGLYRKFEVRRVGGSDAPGGKHHGCRYFVLDVDHDPFAVIALGAYAAVCEDTHPKLARDLIEEWGASAMNPKSDPIALWAKIHHLSTLLKRKDFPALKSLHAELDTLRWMSTVKDDPWDQAIEAVRKRIAQIIETESK